MPWKLQWLWVHQGHWKCHHSIERIWLAMCCFLDIHLVKKYCDFEFRVRGHSRSLKVVPFDRLVMVSYWCSIVTLSPKSTVFWEKWCNLEIQVKGHRNWYGYATYDFLLYSNHGPISHRFRDRRRFQTSKIANFPYPHVYNAPAEGVNQAINQSINQPVLFQATRPIHEKQRKEKTHKHTIVKQTERQTDIKIISPVGDWRSTSLEWWPWRWPWFRPYGIPSCITQRDLYLRTRFHWDRKKIFFEGHHWGFGQVQSHVTQKLGQISKIRPDQI